MGRVLFIAFVLALPQARSSAQRSPTLTGRVADALGQALPGVVVTAGPMGGGQVTQTHTRDDGTYRLTTGGSDLYQVDFDLPGFDLVRHNRVAVVRDAPTRVDATLEISAICDCVRPTLPPVAERAGQVLSASGRPLPHARLEITASPDYHEVALADLEGRFRVRAPIKGVWQVVATRSGFAPGTLDVSGVGSEPVVFHLTPVEKVDIPPKERLVVGCGCPRELFTFVGR